MQRIQPLLLLKSDAGQAIAYILKNWLALTRYLEDGDLAIDNNRTERSLRGIAVGRNNWTFLSSDRGGRTMAILRSFVSSCEINQVDPFAWFRDVLGRIASHSIRRSSNSFPIAGPLRPRNLIYPHSCLANLGLLNPSRWSCDAYPKSKVASH